MHRHRTHRRALISTTSLSGVLGGVCMLLSGVALANPEGGIVAAGAASISSAGNTLTVNQATDKAIINWQSFDIKAGETTHFQQPSSNSVALNRVVGSEQRASQIAGNLTANGKVVIVNPNGVFFDKTARVDVAGLVASTADIANADFMAGKGNFDQASPNKAAKILNHGNISIKDKGMAAFVAPTVVNNGVITARMGKTELGGAETATVDLYGDGLLSLAVSDSTLKTLVENNGAIINDGGTITMTATAASQILDAVVKNTGRVIANNNGKITVTANHTNLESGSSLVSDGVNGGTITVNTRTASFNGSIAARGITDNGGRVSVTATGQVQATSAHSIDVSGVRKGGTIKQEAAGTFSSASYKANSSKGAGGSIEIGGNVGLLGATLNASGATAGGKVHVGGGWQGKSSLKNATNTFISQGSTLDASVTGKAGAGGEVVVWADNKTEFYGSLNVRGGSSSGAGGKAEISGKTNLTYNPKNITTGYARNGRGGSLLLDPTDIYIANSPPEALAAVKTAFSFANTTTQATGMTLAAGDLFGQSVALNGAGDILAVGAFVDDTGGTDRGAAYIFSLNTSDLTVNPTFRQKIASGSAGLTLADGDLLGTGVALNNTGDILAIGARADDTGGTDRGAVYLFNLNTASLSTPATYRQKITHGTGGLSLTDSDLFGYSVAFNGTGNILAVGAYADDTGGTDRGAAYLFSLNTADLTQTATLQQKIASGTAGLNLNNSDTFGFGVA